MSDEKKKDGSPLGNVEPPLWLESRGERCCVSVDMLRARFSFAPDSLMSIINSLERFMHGDMRAYPPSPRAGGYRYLYAWTFDDVPPDGCVAVIGLGHNAGGSVEPNGYLEVNPNRCGNSAGFAALLRLLLSFVKTNDGEITRFDLAYDLPGLCRDDVRLLRKRTKYEYVRGGDAALTEYEGTRNRAGRVKLYDKQKESGLASWWTRIELTCSPSWGLSDVLSALPRVFFIDDRLLDFSAAPDASGGVSEPPSRTAREYARAARLIASSGLPVDDFLDSLTYRMKRQVISLLTEGGTRLLEYESEPIENTLFRFGDSNSLVHFFSPILINN